MIVTFLVLGLVILVEILVVLGIFNFTKNNVDDSTRNVALINSGELLVLLATIGFSMYITLYRIMDGVEHGFLIGFAYLAIIVVWLFLRIKWFRTAVGLDMGISRPNNKIRFEPVFNGEKENNNNSNRTPNRSETVPKTRSDKDFVVFSKYIDKDRNNNFGFHALYPDYGDLASELKVKADSTDYSAYNGYPDGHICSGCKCMEKEGPDKDSDTDDDIFCGKIVPGMGTIGCSDNWGCMNCRLCKSKDNYSKADRPISSSTTGSASDYTCANCKCHDTSAGYICGKIDRTNGYIHKCDANRCSQKCDTCYGADSSSLFKDAGMITVNPESKLSNVKKYNNNLNNV